MMKNRRPPGTLSGFTLVELMIVVAIVAILAAIAVPMYGEYIRKSRTSEAVSNLGSIALYEETYFSENDRYQTASENPTSVPTLGNRLLFSAAQTGWTALGNVVPNNTPLYFQYEIFAGQVNSATADVTGNNLLTISGNNQIGLDAGQPHCTATTSSMSFSASSLGITNNANSNWFYATAVGDQTANRNCSLFIKVIDRPDISIERDIE